MFLRLFITSFSCEVQGAVLKWSKQLEVRIELL